MKNKKSHEKELSKERKYTGHGISYANESMLRNEVRNEGIQTGKILDGDHDLIDQRLAQLQRFLQNTLHPSYINQTQTL